MTLYGISCHTPFGVDGKAAYLVVKTPYMPFRTIKRGLSANGQKLIRQEDLNNYPLNWVKFYVRYIKEFRIMCYV
jgi:hypothetical protein